MTYKGTVKNGVVVLEGSRLPPDGAPVSVRLLKSVARRRGTGKPARSTAGRRKSPPSLRESLRPFLGMAKGLPSDFSVNHDHYLYGTTKEE